MLNSMHIYTVHTQPGKALGDMPPRFSFRDFFASLKYQPSPLFVREGFNIWAFLFTLFWAFYQRLWLVGIAVIALNIGVTYLEKHQYITEMSSFILLLTIQIVIGFHGNDWIRSKLKRRGYITAGIVSGDNRMRAEQRFFEQYLEPAY